MKRKNGKFDYFAAFARQAELAVEEAELLIEIAENFEAAKDVRDYIPKAHEIENKADDVHHSIHDALMPDFVPPLDREDITSLSSALDEVVDEIEELILSFYMYDIHFMHDDAVEFAKLIHQACIALHGAVREFPQARKSEAFKKYILEVNDIEEASDRLHLKLMRQLYTHESDHVMRVVIWSQIFELFEDVADQCETIADHMQAIVLKNG